ncbi:hypothetical protein N7532_000334 [Penicillium argentinense]|uniref:EthD domain-containing protein n=1 Tax=Penicillium argentinense TaxID=1131581 RepID=A0A9W9KMI7_9EURO|nr:uncharacterized protein N7532_000334 [Penicillium argentinense]KAJ5112289.1 hypothetical protein N7532_000334 [Penicillium argentinense]
MTVKVLIYAYRKPGLSIEEFKKRYETHAALVKQLAGADFPFVTNAPTSPAPPSRLPRMKHFDFDAYAELTFVDQAALGTFTAKVQSPEIARRIEEDEEEFLDRGRLGIAMLGEVCETTN